MRTTLTRLSLAAALILTVACSRKSEAAIQAEEAAKAADAKENIAARKKHRRTEKLRISFSLHRGEK